MSNRFQLCSTNSKTGITRVIRHVRFEEGMRLVEKNKAEPVLHDETGSVLGFELREQVKPAHILVQQRAFREYVKTAMPAPRQSCTAFSKAEVEAIAGLRGRSQTAHLTENEKAERIRRRWQAEDIVESAEQKLEVYKSVH